MGRKPTGAKCVRQALKIDLSWMLKNGYFQPGKLATGVMIWREGWRSQPERTKVAEIAIQTISNEFMVLRYQIIYQTGEAVTKECRVDIATVPSNLGKGNVLYFVCPETGRRCRVLYNCYNSPIWKSREAYSHRIYYDTQQESKMNRANGQWWDIEHLLPKLRTPVRKSKTYAGKPTRRMQRIYRLWDKQIHLDKKRWAFECMTVGVRKEVEAGRLKLPTRS
jgi:hypothetical protein